VCDSSKVVFDFNMDSNFGGGESVCWYVFTWSL